MSSDIVATMAGAFERKRIGETSLHVDPALGPVRVDPLRLRQVLDCYLSNALKFTADEGRVEARILPEGETPIPYRGQDTGIWIAESDLPRLFEAFSQVSSGMTRKYEGSGLGLALARRLVEAQGGNVGVRSTPGVGSVFYLVLPRDGGSVSERQAAP